VPTPLSAADAIARWRAGGIGPDTFTIHDLIALLDAVTYDPTIDAGAVCDMADIASALDIGAARPHACQSCGAESWIDATGGVM
jgi:hypothetical protein